MSNLDWDKFVQATKNRKPIGFLVEAVKKIKSSKRLALDLGCGAGIDAKYLAENGFQVEAIDFNQDSINQTEELCKGLSITVIQSNIIDYEIKPDNYQLIISWNTLPFLKKEDAKKVLYNIQKGLAKEGIFVFGLFGVKDDWAKNHPEMSFWTITELQNLLSEIKFIKILEIKDRKPGATGEVKFWHQIQGIAQCKS